MSDLESLISRAERLLARLEAALPQAITGPDWQAATAFRYRKRTAGWGAPVGLLEPVRHIAPIALDDLHEIDEQKARMMRNVEQFVQGRPFNHVLLTGARGTGKSSLIKACLNAFASQGLRLIEMDKADLVDLPDMSELLATRPEKFLIFCDDLSFDEGESGYKALKSILDGSVAASTPNVLICATSNRRHLLPEYMQDNLHPSRSPDGELHPGEAVEEKISLSERFGIWISFYPFSQEAYLAIVRQWLHSLGLPAAEMDKAMPQALVWALERGSRSGRVARQFANDYMGRHLEYTRASGSHD
ncbi:MAG: ATP-binding protein [Brachymonas sp.]|nr:ATP-binding protein [Brachymonas sp.]